MGVPKLLLLKTAEIVGLDDEVELFQALAELGKAWKGKVENIDGFTTANELVDAIADGTRNENVIAAFAKLKAPGTLTVLQAQADKLKELIAKIPKEIADLLEPIGVYDDISGARKGEGKIEWPLLSKNLATDSPDDDDAAKPDYSLSLGTQASLSIDADDKWNHGGNLSGPMLSIKAKGSLKAKAGLALPFTGGLAKGSSEGSAGCIFEYYFTKPEPNHLYALAVADSIRNLVDPFDFDAVWKHLIGTNLAGIYYELKGDAAASVSVSLADSADLSGAFKADFGATLTVNFRLRGNYALTFYRDTIPDTDTPCITGAIFRTREESLGAKLDIGATIDLSALATRVHALLKKGLDQWDVLLKDITPFLSPGTWLQGQADKLISQQATKLIEDEVLKNAMTSDLRGVIGIGTPSDSELLEWLETELTGALDAAQGWADKQAEAATTLLDKLGRNLPAFAQPAIREKLQGTAEALVKRVSDQLTATVTALLDSKKDGFADALNDALKAAGEKNKRLIKTADDALEAVRAIIAKYDTLFRKVVSITEDAANAKISAAIQLEESRTKGEIVEIKGTFLSNDAMAGDIFRSMTRGDINTLLKLMDTPPPEGSFLLSSESSLERYASRKTGVGMELVLFGFGVSGSDLLRSDASVLIDGAGNIRVETEVSLKKRFSGRDATREITLVSSYSLVLLKRPPEESTLPSITRGIEFSVVMGHIDDDLKRGEATDFVRSLAEAGLIAPSVEIAANNGFSELVGSSDPKGSFSGALQLKLLLQRSGMEQLLGLHDVDPSEAKDPNLSEAKKEAIVLHAFQALRTIDLRKKPLVDSTIADLRKRAPDVPLEEFLTNRKRLRKFTYEGIKVSPSHEEFHKAVDMSHDFLAMIEKMREIYFAKPETSEDENKDTWGPEKYRDAEHQSVKFAHRWLKLGSFILWSAAEVPASTLAFFKAICDSANVPLHDAIALTMWRKDPDKTPKTLAFISPPAE